MDFLNLPYNFPEIEVSNQLYFPVWFSRQYIQIKLTITNLLPLPGLTAPEHLAQCVQPWRLNVLSFLQQFFEIEDDVLKALRTFGYDTVIIRDYIFKTNNSRSVNAYLTFCNHLCLEMGQYRSVSTQHIYVFFFPWAILYIKFFERVIQNSSRRAARKENSTWSLAKLSQTPLNLHVQPYIRTWNFLHT